MDHHLTEMDGLKEGEPLYSSLGKPPTSGPLTSAHQLKDDEVQKLDALLEDIGRGDMLLILMDMERKEGHVSASYLSERAMIQGAFSLGFVLRTGRFRDMSHIEDLNRELLSLSRSFNGFVGIPPRATMEGRNIDLAHLIRHLTDMAFTPGVVNLDHADLMLTSKGGSMLVITWGAARPGGNRAATSVKDALTKSLCDVDLRSVRKALVNVVGSGDLTLEDSLVASEVLKKRIRPNSNIIWGVSLVEGMEEDMEVFLILATTPMELLLHWYSHD
jgi:cell division protein FtsZ